jgi:dolichol kinase
LEIIQKIERMERKLKQRTLITLLYFIQFFNAKARIVQEHKIYVLIFFSSSYYLPKKEKYTKKRDSIIYFFFLFFSFHTLYFPSFQE